MIQSIHWNRTSQSAPSSLGTRQVTEPPAANQNREQIITRLPNGTRMLRVRWSHAHVTQPQNMKSPKYLFVCACILFCDWIDVFIVILWLDCSTDIFTNVLIKGLYGFTINSCVLIPFIILDINVFFSKSYLIIFCLNLFVCFWIFFFWHRRKTRLKPKNLILR